MGNLLEVITEGRREAPCAPGREGGGGLSFSLSQRTVFLWWCSCSLCSTQGLVRGWEGHPWSLEESLFKSKESLTHLSLPVCLRGLPFQFLLGLIQSQEKGEWYSWGSHAALQTHSSSGKAPFSYGRLDDQGRVSTATSGRDFLEPWQEVKRLCLHVSIWFVPSSPGHLTWQGTLCYLFKDLSKNPPSQV